MYVELFRVGFPPSFARFGRRPTKGESGRSRTHAEVVDSSGDTTTVSSYHHMGFFGMFLL